MSVPVIRRTLKDSSAQLSWSKVAVVPVVEKVTVTYPIFWTLACATSDPKWLQILESFYHGKFLTKFSYTPCILKYRKDKKTFSCTLNENAPYESFELFRVFVGKHSGVVSQQEIEEYERQAEIESENMAKKTWADHTQVMKNCILEMFFDNCTKTVQLNNQESRQLRSLVHYALMFGYLKDQIVVENNEIQYISGLHFDETARKFYLDPNLRPRALTTSKKKASKAKSAVHFDKVWSKVCEHYPHLQ